MANNGSTFSTPVFCSHRNEAILCILPQSQLSLQAVQNSSAAFKLSVLSSLPWDSTACLLLSVIHNRPKTAHLQSAACAAFSYPTACPGSQLSYSLARSQGPALPSSSPPRQHLHHLWLRQDCSSQNQDLEPLQGGRGGNKALDMKNTPVQGTEGRTQLLQDSVQSPLPTQEHKLPAQHTAPRPLPKV